MHLFLDTNIYLAFYKLSDDDLDELEKLAVTVRSGTTVLYLTDQVRDEFRRNRAGTISESLKAVETSRLPNAFPRLFTNLPGYADLRATLALFEHQRGDLLAQAREAAIGQTLQADRLIQGLFEIAVHLPLNDGVLSAAQRRHSLGNPPGKKDSIGDAVNWESLLAGVPNGEDLVLVTADRDYVSKLSDDVLDEFLTLEWNERKNSTISGHRSLTALFSRYYPEIRLAADLEKELAIDALVSSPNFRSTHLAIQRLTSFVDFTVDQVLTMVEAASTNSQVRQLLQDADVKMFFTDIAERFGESIPPVDLATLRERMGDGVPETI
jgi:hypothetical protein